MQLNWRKSGLKAKATLIFFNLISGGLMKRSKLFMAIVGLFCIFCLVGTASAIEKSVKAAKQAKAKPSLSGNLNINTASVEELAMLPRIGAKTAKAIIDYRSTNGSFKAVEDLMQVKGVGEKMLKMLKPYIALDGKSTLMKE
jgi:comEA protein